VQSLVQQDQSWICYCHDVFDHYIRVQGKLDGDQNAAVFAEVPGTVSARYANVGQTVVKGQVLAQIDDQQYRNQLESLEAQYQLSSELFDKRRREARPARLMARSDTGPIVPVEILVEWDAVTPVRIGLKLFLSSEYSPAPVSVTDEDAGQAVRDLPSDLEEVHLPARAGRTLNLERIAVELVEVDECPDDNVINRHPHRAAPVGVATEHF